MYINVFTQILSKRILVYEKKREFRYIIYNREFRNIIEMNSTLLNYIVVWLS